MPKDAYLLVVHKDGGLELLRNPLEQIPAVLRLDIDEHALGEEDGGQGVVHFGLLQLVVHLVEVALREFNNKFIEVYQV